MTIVHCGLVYKIKLKAWITATYEMNQMIQVEPPGQVLHKGHDGTASQQFFYESTLVPLLICLFVTVSGRKSACTAA